MLHSQPFCSACRRCLATSLFLLLGFATANGDTAEESISFPHPEAHARHVSVNFQVDISGEISTPGAQGVQRFPLSSSGRFRFAQKQFNSDQAGPYSLKAIRKFDIARTETTVGKDHRTTVSLPLFYRTIHAYGSDDGLQQLSPRYSLPRKHVDLLQMPFDVLPAQALLTSSEVRQGDRWNAAAWVTPMLVGVSAVVKQSVTCTLESYSETEATVAFEGIADGAVDGSATDVKFQGRLTVDRNSGLITSLKATQTEKRSPGPVSPGLDITVLTSWTQKPESTSSLADDSMQEAPSRKSLQLMLQTPLKLQLIHSREWHLFHETPAVLMMRQLRNGNLVSQCNISNAVTVPPGEHTPDDEFLADVSESVKQRKGSVLAEETVRDDGKWRIRRVRAVGNASGDMIQWDYFLCAAATGEQFSIVFSYSQADSELFGDEATRLLSTLQIARKRPSLPYQ